MDAVQQALGHIWLSGKNATDHDLLPELRRAREAKAKLKHAILAVSLKKRIQALRAEESDPESSDMGDAEAGIPSTVPRAVSPAEKPNIFKGGDAFRAVVQGAVRDKKQKDEDAAADKELEEALRRGHV